MKLINFLIVFLLIFGFSFAKKQLINKQIDGHQVKLIKVKLDRGHKIGTSVSLSGESFQNLLKKQGADTGVNGVYFCPKDYSYCGGKNWSSADRIYKGKNFSKYWPDTGAKGMFGFDKQGDFLFIQNHLGYAEGYQRKINTDLIDQVYYGLSNHPILIIGGENLLSKEQDDVLDNKILQNGGKSFICITKNYKNVYMGYVNNINMYELPSYLNKNFGCYYALNLDSGASSGMMYDGKLLMKPNRKIMDAFVVLENPLYDYLSEKQRNKINGIMINYLKNYEKHYGTLAVYKKTTNLLNKIKALLKNPLKPRQEAILLELKYILKSYY